MKKPIEYIEEYDQYEVMYSDEEFYLWEDVEGMIKKAQKDAAERAFLHGRTFNRTFDEYWKEQNEKNNM